MSRPNPAALRRRLLSLVLLVALTPAGCRATLPLEEPGLTPVSSGDYKLPAALILGPPAIVALAAALTVGVVAVATLDVLLSVPLALAEAKQAPLVRWIFQGGPNPFGLLWDWLAGAPRADPQPKQEPERAAKR